MVDFRAKTLELRRNRLRVLRGDLRVIIAGSRDIPDPYQRVTQAMAGWEMAFHQRAIEVVSGTARGVDKAGERWAEERGIPVKRMPANWDEEGPGAGYNRNRRMALYADALVAVWDGKSKGTGNMIEIMMGMGKLTYVYTLS